MKSQKKDKEPSPLAQDRFTEKVWSVQAVMVRRSSRKFTPPTDVIEFPDRLVVLIEIAGVRAGDLQISLHNHMLVISGMRERPPFDNPAYHQVEIGFGEFRVEVQLPWAVRQEEVSATYGDGFLQIDLPRLAPTQVHINDVNTEEQE